MDEYLLEYTVTIDNQSDFSVASVFGLKFGQLLLPDDAWS